MMLNIYYARIDELPPGEGMALSSYRREKNARLRSEEKIRAGTGAEHLLCHALNACGAGEAQPLEIICGAHGKPALKSGRMEFSLSHSGGWCAAAICDAPVGVDVQRLVPFNPALAKRFFTADEQEYIASQSDRDMAFTRIWGMKESYIKALGLGLSMPLNSFSALELEAHIWHTALEACILAVCVPTRTDIKPDIIEKLGLP